jgi:hypothetical protein
MSRKSWKEKRQWVHLMVIVEKKAKNEEVWVNCNLSDVEVRRKPASTQHSIGERRRSYEGR